MKFQQWPEVQNSVALCQLKNNSFHIQMFSITWIKIITSLKRTNTNKSTGIKKNKWKPLRLLNSSNIEFHCTSNETKQWRDHKTITKEFQCDIWVCSRDLWEINIAKSTSIKVSTIVSWCGQKKFSKFNFSLLKVFYFYVAPALR